MQLVERQHRRLRATHTAGFRRSHQRCAWGTECGSQRRWPLCRIRNYCWGHTADIPGGDWLLRMTSGMCARPVWGIWWRLVHVQPAGLDWERMHCNGFTLEIRRVDQSHELLAASRFPRASSEVL